MRPFARSLKGDQIEKWLDVCPSCTAGYSGAFDLTVGIRGRKQLPRFNSLDSFSSSLVNRLIRPG